MTEKLSPPFITKSANAERHLIGAPTAQHFTCKQFGAAARPVSVRLLRHFAARAHRRASAAKIAQRTQKKVGRAMFRATSSGNLTIHNAIRSYSQQSLDQERRNDVLVGTLVNNENLKELLV